MNLGRCPTCHSHLDLVAMMEDESGRELLALISRTPSRLNRALLPYLTLFRPPLRDLSLSRTLMLAEEVMAITRDVDTLIVALVETTEAIRSKGAGKPMKSHGYLKSVLAALVEKHGIAQPVANPDRDVPDLKPKSDNETAWRRQMMHLGVEVSPDGQVVIGSHHES